MRKQYGSTQGSLHKGTKPRPSPLHGGSGSGNINVSGWDTPPAKQPLPPPSPQGRSDAGSNPGSNPASSLAANPAANPAGRPPDPVTDETQAAGKPPEKKKGFFRRLIGVVK